MRLILKTILTLAVALTLIPAYARNELGTDSLEFNSLNGQWTYTAGSLTPLTKPVIYDYQENNFSEQNVKFLSKEYCNPVMQNPQGSGEPLSNTDENEQQDENQGNVTSPQDNPQ